MPKRRTFIIVCAVLTLVLVLGSVTALGGSLSGILNAVGEQADAESYESMLKGYKLGGRQTFDEAFTVDKEGGVQYYTSDRLWRIVARPASHTFTSYEHLTLSCIGKTDALSFESTDKSEFGTELVFSVDLKAPEDPDVPVLHSRYSIKTKDAAGAEKSIPLFTIDNDGDIELAELSIDNVIYPHTEVTRLSRMFYKTLTCKLSLETRLISVYVDGMCVIRDAEFVGLPEGENTISRPFYFYGFNGSRNVGASIELDNIEYYYTEV